MLIGPSLSNAQWRLEQVWDTGYIPAYSEYLNALAIETYVCLSMMPDNAHGFHRPFGIQLPQQQLWRTI